MGLWGLARRAHLLLLGCVLLAIPITAIGAPRVLFFNPTWQGHPHWQRISDTMQLAAGELGLQLEVVYSGQAERNNRQAYMERVISAAQRQPKPDYVVFMFYKSMGATTLAALEAAHIPSVTINTPIPPDERGSLGNPKGQFSYWLGHIAPDDKKVGAQLAVDMQQLVPNDWLTHGPADGEGLTGDWLSSAAQDRKDGLLTMVQSDKLRIRQVVPAAWDTQEASKKTLRLLQRYPALRFFWCASDTMALGVIAALKEQGLWQPGYYLVGGVDWTEEGLRSIARGELTASIGGHFLDGGWAMVLIHDHANGVDLATINTQLDSPMKTLTKVDIPRFIPRLQSISTQPLYFSPFSLLSSGKSYYDFDIEIALGLSRK